MSKNSVVEFHKPGEMRDAFSAYIRQGAQRLIAQAVQAELEELLAGFAGQKSESGRRAVVRNGFLPERSILTGIGLIPVRMPKVRSRTEDAAVFHSVRVPSYVRRAHSVEAALPLLAWGVHGRPVRGALGAGGAGGGGTVGRGGQSAQEPLAAGIPGVVPGIAWQGVFVNYPQLAFSRSSY